MTIHPTAEIDATAHIADGCEIGPFAVVGPRSHLGARTGVQHAGVGNMARSKRLSCWVMYDPYTIASELMPVQC